MSCKTKLATASSLIIGLGIALSLKAAVAQKPDSCGNLQTQMEMNNCEADRANDADADMNRLYKKLLVKYRSDAEFLKKLRLAQLAWRRFRDAQMNSLYYLKGKPGVYGSVFPMCWAMESAQLTTERIKELTYILDPEEGDVCCFQSQEISPNTKPRVAHPRISRP